MGHYRGRLQDPSEELVEEKQERNLCVEKVFLMLSIAIKFQSLNFCVETTNKEKEESTVSKTTSALVLDVWYFIDNNVEAINKLTNVSLLIRTLKRHVVVIRRVGDKLVESSTMGFNWQ